MGRVTTSEFIVKAQTKHKNKFYYDKSIYVTAKQKIIVTCKTHGDFLVKPLNHLNTISGGCPDCKNYNNTIGQQRPIEEFIKIARKIHKHKYDYSKVVQTGHNKKVIIICKKHGEFLMTPHNHIHGCGCKECMKEKFRLKMSKTEWKRRAKEKFKNKFDYSKITNIIRNKKIEIICPEHGSFFQEPFRHLKSARGCPYCKFNRTGSVWENFIHNILINNNVLHKREFRFPDCRYINPLPFDFAIFKSEKDYVRNKPLFLIEYQGHYHFKPNRMKKENQLKGRIRDKIKKNYCMKNNIRLYIINYFDNVEKEILTILKRRRLYKRGLNP